MQSQPAAWSSLGWCRLKGGRPPEIGPAFRLPDGLLPRADTSDFEELAQEIWVDCGVDLFAVDTAVDGFVFSEAVEGEAVEDGEVGDGMAGACAARVLAEGDFQNPVALVLDGPVAAHGARELGDVLDLPVAAGLNRPWSRR